jgi:DNA-binding MltR family transcriptional regulator
MEKSPTLRELSRRWPAKPEIDAVMDSLKDRDDLHTAIIAVSIVEATLEEIIVTRLHSRGKDLLRNLFENQGPLSDFNSKILIAQAFGIITPPMTNELNVMRKVRNAFAHARIPLSFEDEPVGREIKRLRIIAGMDGTEIPGPPGDVIKMKLPNKAAFLLAIRIILIIFDSIFKSKRSADEVLADALGGEVLPTTE